MDETLAAGSVADDRTIELTVDLIAAYVSHNSIPATELPMLIAGAHAALVGLSQDRAAEPQVEKLTPAQIRKSITPDALISFIDGKPYKTLKRHIGRHGMTIEGYQKRYGLPSDYPSVAVNYSEARSSLAKNLGLGRSRKEATPKVADVADTVTDAPSKPTRARKPKKVE